MTGENQCNNVFDEGLQLCYGLYASVNTSLAARSTLIRKLDHFCFKQCPCRAFVVTRAIDY
jgi:hypothetical protein